MKSDIQVVPTLAERQSQTHAARQAPRCRHLKANGEPCRAAASLRRLAGVSDPTGEREPAAEILTLSLRSGRTSTERNV